MRILLVVGVIAAVFVVLLLFTLRSVSVTSASLTGIEEINRDHLRLNGTLTIANEGFVPLQVTRGTVDLFLAEDGTRLTSSEFSSFWLSAGQERDISFTLLIEWEPTSMIVKDLMAGGKGTLFLEGKMLVLQVFSFNFRERFDLRPLLVNLAKKTGEALIDSAERYLQDLWNRIEPR